MPVFITGIVLKWLKQPREWILAFLPPPKANYPSFLFRWNGRLMIGKRSIPCNWKKQGKNGIRSAGPGVKSGKPGSGCKVKTLFDIRYLRSWRTAAGNMRIITFTKQRKPPNLPAGSLQKTRCQNGQKEPGFIRSLSTASTPVRVASGCKPKTCANPLAERSAA